MLKIILSQKNGEVLLNKEKNDHGFTMIEALFGVVMVLASALLLAQIVQGNSIFFGRTMDKKAEERMISNIINEAKADLSHFQITQLSDQDPTAVFPTTSTFPLYWDRRNEYMSEDDCKAKNLIDSEGNCRLPGRLAYLIQPVRNLPNLFHMTIISHHPNVHPSDDATTRVDIFINK